MEKRGQATIFIIVGIVVLAVIGGLFAVRAGYFDVYLNSNRNKVIVSQETVPVQQYLESCLADNLILGLDYLSTQGGYLEIDSNNDINGFSNMLETYPSYRTMYWYYEDSQGNQIIKMPTKEEVEEQLNR